MSYWRPLDRPIRRGRAGAHGGAMSFAPRGGLADGYDEGTTDDHNNLAGPVSGGGDRPAWLPARGRRRLRDLRRGPGPSVRRCPRGGRGRPADPGRGDLRVPGPEWRGQVD